MPTPFEKKSIRNLGIYGIIRPATVDDYLIPEGAVTEAVNVNFDRIGAVTVRPGITTLGATIQAGYPIWGLHNTQSGSMMAVISQGASARVYAYAGASWLSSLADGTANVRTRFLEAGGRTIVLNFGSATTMYSSVRFFSTADTWVTTGNPINPQAITDQVARSVQPRFGEVYKSRIYLAGGNTNGTNIDSSRLWYSNVISAAGNFAWTPTADFVDINPNDGENITGLKRYALKLLVFKPNNIYQFSTAGVDPDPLIKVGTRSNESIIEGKKGLYFHHDSGFYRYTGAYPTDISRPISDIVQAITYANYLTISSWKDDNNIYWNVGDLTIDGNSLDWRNCVVRYTESSEVWTVYSYPNEVPFASTYDTGAALSRVLGLDNGVVATLNSGTTDLREPIKYRMITKWYEWEGVENRKIIQEFIALCEKAQETRLMYQTDGNIEWNDLGQLKKYLNYFKQLNIKFHRIRFKVSGTSRDEAPIFLGLEITKGTNEGPVEQ